MSVASFSQSLADIVTRGEEMPKLQGVGKDIEGKIIEIVKTGKLKQLEELEKEVPASLIELMKLPGLGPKKVKVLFDKLGIETFDQMEKAARDGKIADLKGFGEKTQQKILQEIEQRKGVEKQNLLSTTKQAADELIKYLKKIKGIGKVEAAGSFQAQKRNCRGPRYPGHLQKCRRGDEEIFAI